MDLWGTFYIFKYRSKFKMGKRTNGEKNNLQVLHVWPKWKQCNYKMVDNKRKEGKNRISSIMAV